MKKTLLISMAAVACLAATPALAQDFPDLPGMDPARNAIPAQDGSGTPAAGAGSGATGRATTDAPAAPAGPVRPVSDEAPELLPSAATDDPAPEVRPAPAAGSTASGDALPSTGAAIGGLALLGIALTAGGGLLRELVRGR